MGARQSRRSVDITTTPKKEGIPAEGGVVSEGAEKIEKLGMIEEADAKPTSNGVAPHTDSAEDKDKDKDEATEKEQDKEKQPEETAEAVKEEAKLTEPSSGVVAAVAEVTAEAAPAEVTTPTEAASTPATPNSTATTPDTKEAKKKDKSKKKWSFRSISFSRKDKSKPVREATPKNGDVAKEEPLAEGGEEAEVAAATTVEAASPEDKSTVSSPTEESKEEAKDEKSMSEEAATPASPVSPISPSSLAEEQPAKKEEPSIPAPLEVVAPAALPESKVECAPDPELVAAILENNLVVKSEIVPMENGVADEAPKSPPPAVPVEASQPAPAITEDVTSVTKAIEEIDISEKAVAAAVNENIESTGANEIVVDSIHQNNLNE